MKIMILADPHIHKPGWGDRYQCILKDAQSIASNETIDVFYCAGDILYFGYRNKTHYDYATTEQMDDFHRYVQALSRLPIRHKIWCVGNHELKIFHGPIVNYANNVQDILTPYGFHVLDCGPYYVGNIAFTGNMAWYDGTGYVEPETNPDGAPVVYNDVKASADKWFQEEYNGRVNGITSDSFFQLLKRRRIDDWTKCVHDNKNIVLCTHVSPGREFLLYGKSPEYDYRNWWLCFNGADESIYHDKRTILGLSSHSHRQKEATIGTIKVINVGHLGVVEV